MIESSGATETFDIDALEVIEVIEWASTKGSLSGRMFAIAAIVPSPEEGLVWLVGTSDTQNGSQAERNGRMSLRASR